MGYLYFSHLAKFCGILYSITLCRITFPFLLVKPFSRSIFSIFLDPLPFRYTWKINRMIYNLCFVLAGYKFPTVVIMVSQRCIMAVCPILQTPDDAPPCVFGYRLRFWLRHRAQDGEHHLATHGHGINMLPLEPDRYPKCPQLPDHRKGVQRIAGEAGYRIRQDHIYVFVD